MEGGLERKWGKGKEKQRGSARDGWYGSRVRNFAELKGRKSGSEERRYKKGVGKSGVIIRWQRF